MSKEISKQLAKCPFCNEELERHCTSRYYMHKLNGCILQHFCFETDDELSIDLWNTRKPLERIVERLEEEFRFSDSEKHRCIKENPLQFDYAKGYAYGIYNAIEIVKEEGEMNEKVQ